jgi:hypothetical protein
LRHSSISTP